MAVWNVIDHTELGGVNAELVDWTSISSSYDHLYVIASAGSNTSANTQSYTVQLNGETAVTNYSHTGFNYNGSMANVQSTTDACVAGLPRMSAAFVATDSFSCFEMWLPNYSNTDHFKPAIVKNTAPNTTTSSTTFYLQLNAGLWSNTAAIDQITLTASADSFLQYSSATLYGINGAA
jgi:hypothetical protein